MASPEEKRIAAINKQIAQLEAQLAVIASDNELINSELEKLLTVETREAAENSLYSFYSQAWSVFETVPFMGNWHLQCICEHLEAVFRGDIQNIIFECPPRCSKSSIINIAFPVWCWLHSPQTKFITAAHGESLAVRDSVKSRQLIDSPWFKRNWGDKVKLKLGVNQKMKYENEENGYRIATSVGGRGVGEGYDCQTPYTKILTNKGPIAIEKLYNQQDPSIEVFCYDVDGGLIKKVKPKKYLRNTLRDREIVRINFKDGSYTDCTADHKWYTAELGYVEAQDLNKSLSILSWETTYKEVETIQVLNNQEFSSSYYVYTLSMPPYGNYFVVPEGSDYPVLAKNCLIVDDPHKPSEINSAASLNSVIEWWTGTMPSRANSPTSKRVVMHQRLSECVDGEADILLNTLELKKLKDVKPGDFVQSSQGFSEVLATQNKGSQERSIYYIYKWGQSNPLKVTEEHPVFTLNRGFVEAKYLNTDDILLDPSTQHKEKLFNPEILNLVETPQPRKRKKSRVSNSRVYKEDLEYVLKNYKNKTTTEKAQILGFKNRSGLQDAVSLYGLEHLTSKYNSIDFEDYIYNCEFWRFVGWWVAEGSCTKNVIHLAFHNKEKYYHQSIKKLFEKDCPVTITYGVEDNACKVVFSCNNLGLWLKREFGERAESKKLPSWFLDLPKEFQLSFIKGFYEGDGSYNKNYYRFSSTSKTLLKGLKYVLQTHQIKSLLYVTKTSHFPAWELRVDTSQPWLDFKPVQTTDFKREKSWTHVFKVRKIEIKRESIPVFDIKTTSGDFVAEGILVHNCDLIGHIKSNEEGIWEVITLPMEYSPTTFVSCIGWSDPRKQEGEVLWPERFPPFEITRLKKELGSFGYAAQCLQTPVAKEGGIIKKDWFNYYPTIFSSYTLKEFQLIIQSWDLSFGNTGDYTVGQVWGRRGPNKYLLDQVRGKWTFTEQLREIRNLNARWPQTRIILVENAANGAAAIDTLKREIPGLIPINPKEIGGGDKETRVSACSLDFEAGNVYVPSHQIAPWIGDYIHELTTFPKAKYDDQSDSTALALNWFAAKGGNTIALMASQDELKDLNRIIPSKYSQQAKNSTKKGADFSSAPRSITSQNSIRDLKNIF